MDRTCTASGSIGTRNARRATRIIWSGTPIYHSVTGPSGSDNRCAVGGTAVSGSEIPIYYNGSAIGSSGTRDSYFDTENSQSDGLRHSRAQPVSHPEGNANASAR